MFALSVIFHKECVKISVWMSPVKLAGVFVFNFREAHGKKAAFVPADFVEAFIDDISKQKFPDFWEFSTYPLPHPRPQVHVLQSALI